jgi:hypothetical protein
MLKTQEFVEREIQEKAQEIGFKATADMGRQGNVMNYRGYDQNLHLKGSVSVHYEESYANLINYAGRDAGTTFRYGDCTRDLVQEILKRLGLEGVIQQEAKAETAPAAAATDPTLARKQAEKARLASVADAFPFSPMPDDDLKEHSAKTDAASSALLDLDKDLPTIQRNQQHAP